MSSKFTPSRNYVSGDRKVVILIRDIIDKWKSGYKQELEEKFEHGTNLFNFVDRMLNI